MRWTVTSGSVVTIGWTRCAHLLEMAGDREGALKHYRAAAERTMSIPERNCLATKAARVASDASPNEIVRGDA